MRKYLSGNKWIFVLAVVFGVISSSLMVGISFLIGRITQIVDDRNIEALLSFFYISIAYIVIFAILYFLKMIFKGKFLKDVSSQLKEDIFKGILKLPIDKLNSRNTSDYISVLINDVKILEESYFLAILNIISSLALALVALISFFIINPIVAIVALIVNIIQLFIPKLFEKKISFLKKEYSDELTQYTQRLKDFTSGFEVIKSFNIESFVNKSHKKSIKTLETNRYDYTKVESFLFALSNFSSFFVFIFIFAFGGYYVIKNNMEVAALLTMIQLLNYIGDPIINAIEDITKIKSIKQIKEKILDIVNTEENDINLEEKVSFDKDIIFENIYYSYDNEKMVLNNINITFEKGKKYVIVGNSGSGKSTLLKLLLGYYKDFQGNIKIDDTMIEELGINNINKLISVIHQNVFLFEDTFENNIKLYKDYDLEKLYSVIEKSGLNELLNKLGDGLRTKIEENGKNLSGGEKQRISIARALIKETPILILDEGTSSLDNETAFFIENTILNIPDLTVIVVTHKLSEGLLKKYDEILFLKDGSICERGDFDTLIWNKREFYSLYTVNN